MSPRSGRRRVTLEPGDPRHGTSNGYVNFYCRCGLCRVAHSADQARRKAERRRLMELGLADVDHGLASTYGNWGCRCRPCTDAWSLASRLRKIQSRLEG